MSRGAMYSTNIGKANKHASTRQLLAEQALKKRDASLLVFESKDVLARVEKMGDLFEPVQKLKQQLPQLSGLTEQASAESQAAPEVSEKQAVPTKRSTMVSVVKRAPLSKKTRKTSGKKLRGKKASGEKGRKAAAKRHKI